MVIIELHKQYVAPLQDLHFDLPMNLKVKMKLFLYRHHSIFALLLQIAVTLSINSSNMDLVATKPVFRVSDEVRFKPACSATETS